MRTARILPALVALLLMASVPFLATGSATASSKPKHAVTAKIDPLKKANTFVVTGSVPTFKNKRVNIDLKKCRKGCSYHLYKRAKTSRSVGYFRTGIGFGHRVGDIWCYRVRVPATKNYKSTKVYVGCIRTTR